MPLPDPGTLDDVSRRTYHAFADPDGESLSGLEGPGGIRLHSPALSDRLHPVKLYLRQPEVIYAKTRVHAILVTAREHDYQFE